MKRYTKEIIIIGLLLIYEFIFALMIGSITKGAYFKIMFSLNTGFIISLLLEYNSKPIKYLILIFINLIFYVNLIYYKIFNNILSFNPPSDYEMVKNTIDDYINDDSFMIYYMTMSEHASYSQKNDMVRRNWEKVKDLEYSDNIKGYLAANIELDKALNELLTRLEEANKLKDTIIVMSGDHYPYGLTYEEMENISSYPIDREFDKYKMPFIIYDKNINTPIKVQKYASSLDILPTILNMFGVEYDSRLLMVKDIMSDSESLVIFSNRSFITNIGRYNNYTEEFYLNNKDDKINQRYIDMIQNSIYYKFRISRLILENNYYKYIK